MYGSSFSKGERSEEGEIGSGHPHTMGGLTYAGSGAWEIREAGNVAHGAPCPSSSRPRIPFF